MHTLFNPTPRDQMRELSTDRPDTTESAHTVDAGHFQLEMDNIVLVYDKSGRVKTRGFEVVPMNLKAGLFDSTDVQLVVEPYHRVVSSAPGLRSVDSGYGGTSLRMKQNLVGNDNGRFAVALMPFVRYVDSGFDAGFIVPWAVHLPAGFCTGGILQADLVRQSSGERGVDFIGTLELGHSLFSTFAGYVEMATVVPSYEAEQSSLAVHGGITFGIGKGFQLDAGFRAGAIGPVPTLEAFQGLSGKL